jgi:hypothetical protein|tara:strand:+ start:136 stop:255 length:120 start_codon:yes stop_codon:yes gene_type:complete
MNKTEIIQKLIKEQIKCFNEYSKKMGEIYNKMQEVLKGE